MSNENRQNTTINWFPGHMAKAIREIKEKINLVDMIIEVCDSRAPYASLNPIVSTLTANKFYLRVLSKVDMADEKMVLINKQEFEKQGIAHIFVDLNKKESVKPIVNKIKEVAKPFILKDIKRGLKPRNIRVMIIGIPNVGKSTLINLLAKRKSAQVGNMPGFTKAQKWVHGEGYDLLDTPGILWPNLSENQVGVKLALIGCIKEEILPTLELTSIALNFLSAKYSDLLYNKYGIEYIDAQQYLNSFALKKAHLLKNGELDIKRSALLILNDLKNGKIGKINVDNLEG